MNDRIKWEMISALDAQRRAFNRLTTLRETEALASAVMQNGEGAYWSFWCDSDGLYIGRSFYQTDSIMYNSSVAAELERIESAVDGEFKSSVDSKGDIEYRLDKPGFGRVVITAYLTEAGTCRKVVKGYERRTTTRNVEIEEATPIYGIVCGEGA